VGHERVLGIDAGERRVGVAMSDATGLLAAPVCVLQRVRGLAPVLDALAELARRDKVSRLVIGLPLNADGSEGPQARRARDFARVAERVIGLPVTLWDERLSTREAESILREQGRNLRTARARGQLDAIAAAVILQDFLNFTRASGAGEAPELLPPVPEKWRQGPWGVGPIRC
jgi:putative holliday junction resolvase